MNAFANKALTAAVCSIALALTALAPAAAQTATRSYYIAPDGTRVPLKRPRSRITVEPRSFLDAGTEVLPGQRKFTDYAFPPTHYPLGVVTDTGGRVGWHQSPLPGPFDLRGPNNPFGW
jgi:hypothetical protein